jgi:coniferyl-aldehyde dehydrogenase
LKRIPQESEMGDIDMFSGSVAATVARLSDVRARQRAAFDADLPVAAAARRDRLKRCIAMMKAHGEDFAAAMSEDFGHRSRAQSMLTDIAASIAPARQALKKLDRWMQPEKRSVQFPLGLLGAKARVEYQPKGVVGVISPWNFPVQLTMAPLAGIFAAGNRAMVKSSEFTPVTAAMFESVVPKFFAEDELAFFSGGPEVGQAFAKLPFDHLTGCR